MTTTDANGIVFLQDTDNISPFHTLINGLQTATSTAVEKAGRGPFYAANTTARTALYTAHGASSTNPLWVDMAGTLYRTVDGTTWVSYGDTIHTYTPSWASSGTTPSVGNGTLVGQWKWSDPNIIWLRINLIFGSTSSGGNGNWTFSLPSGITAASTNEQVIHCKAYTTGSRNWAGVGLIGGGGTTISPMLPQGLTSGDIANVRNADGTNAIGTGIPQISGQYTFTNGCNLLVEGFIQTA